MSSKIVFTQAFDVEPWSDHEALITLTFVEQDGKTTITSTSLYQSVEDRDAHLNSGMEEGMVETLDRLAEHLNQS